MPTYSYACATCDHDFEAVQSIKDDALTDCPCCGVGPTRRVLFPPTVFDATPRTAGSAAEKNSGPGRTYWVQEQRRQAEESRLRGREALAERPWWRNSDRVNTQLASMTREQKADYIACGDPGIASEILSGADHA